jgi:hypothetical protein
MIANPQLCWSDMAPRGLSTHLAVLLAEEAQIALSFLLSMGAASTPPPLLLSPRR